MGTSLRELKPPLRPIASAFLSLFKRYVQVTVTSVGRDSAKQRELWLKCKRGQSRFPAAYPGSSPHELGIAFDVHFEPEGSPMHVRGTTAPVGSVYVVAGELWERIGFRWGGRFEDPIHFDFHPRGHVPAGNPLSCRPH